jgi:hypothetical protein
VGGPKFVSGLGTSPLSQALGSIVHSSSKVILEVLASIPFGDSLELRDLVSGTKYNIYLRAIDACVCGTRKHIHILVLRTD